MATDLERLVVQLSADVTKYQNAMNRAQGITNRTARQIEGRFQKMNRLASGSLASFGRGFVGAVAAGFSVREAGQLIDAATRIQNALKVAGLEGAELTKVYDRLFESAQRNAAPFEELVNVYSKAAQAGDDLGASQEELLKLTETVAQALRVSGKSAAEASGALLQLGQALGNGVVQAEEYNSLLDGAYPLLQAVAAGLKEAGGSVSALTRLVKDGQVSSEAFFRAALAGAPILEQKLAGSVLTLSQRMTRLQTALINAAGEFNNSTQASETFGRQIDKVAEFVNSIDFDGLISQIRAVAAEFGLGADAARFFFSEIGRLTGLEGIGGLLTGGTGRAEFLGGALTVTSQSGIQSRIDDAFATAVETAGDLTEEAILRSAREFGGAATTAKTDRLSSTVVDDQVSIKQFPAKMKAAGDAIDKFVAQVVKAESGGNASAKNPLSSATGLGQFIESTWLNLFRENFPAEAANMGRDAILALRTDAETSKTLIEAYARENAAVLQKAGVSVDEAALHLAHFLGPQGAASVLKAAPGTKAADVLSPGAVAANKSILGDGATVEDVIAYAQARAGLNTVMTQEAEILARNRQLVADMIAQGQEETARIQLETSLVGVSNAEREKELFIFERLNELKAAGIPINDQLLASVEAEAAARYGAVAAYDATVAAQDAAAESSERLRQSQEELQYAQQEIAGAFQGALKGLITDLAHGKDATEALLDAVSRLADRLLDIALDMLFQNLFGGLAGGLGGGGLLAGLFHSGGKAGAAVAARTVSPLMFAGAQRYHSGGLAGLKPGEVPAILQRGELVLPRSQVRSMARSGSSSQNVDARTTVVNTFDAGSFLSEALSRPEGVKVVLNAVRAQPGAFRAAINA